MAAEVKEFFEKYKKDSGKMMHELPDMLKSFMGMFENVMKDGALNLKSKELIAMAVGLTVRCKPCIYMHVQKCLQAGATRQEILEAASVVVVMQGGPCLMHIPEVIDALDTLQAG